MTTLQQRLQAALPVAMKARDKTAVTALRSALAAIDNAAAVPPADPSSAPPAIGPASTEVPRRDQDEAELERIVRAEITDRLTAADEYDQLGRPDVAEAKRAEAHALTPYV